MVEWVHVALPKYIAMSSEQRDERRAAYLQYPGARDNPIFGW